MGREIKRVPLDFDFPLEKSYADEAWDKHQLSCKGTVDEEGDVTHDNCEWSYDPPEGEGWQLWQTVSDGPISPVFSTPEELIDWMCQPVPVHLRPRYEPDAYPRMPWAQGWRREVAEPFVKAEGWAPSMVIQGGKAMSGAEFVVQNRKDSDE